MFKHIIWASTEKIFGHQLKHSFETHQIQILKKMKKNAPTIIKTNLIVHNTNIKIL